MLQTVSQTERFGFRVLVGVLCGSALAVVLVLTLHFSPSRSGSVPTDLPGEPIPVSPPNTWERAVARDSQIKAVAEYVHRLRQNLPAPSNGTGTGTGTGTGSASLSSPSAASSAEYFRFFDWQNKPLPAALRGRLENSVVNFRCRVCEAVNADRPDSGPILVYSDVEWIGRGMFQCRLPLGVTCEWTFDRNAVARAHVLATLNPAPPNCKWNAAAGVVRIRFSQLELCVFLTACVLTAVS